MSEILTIRSQIIEMLKTLYDPEIPVNIWELGLIYGVDVTKDGFVTIIMTLTSPNCPVIDILPLQVQEVAESVPGVDQVVVDLVWEPAWDKSLMSDSAKLDLGMI